MMKYKVVTATNGVVSLAATQMEKEVNKFLEEGWTLCGGIFIVKDNDGRNTLVQAITKK